MPKPYTFPVLFDECRTVAISDLKRWDYLISNQWKSGQINWSRNGERQASIGITVDLHEDYGQLTLDYLLNGEKVKYNVQMVSELSNLGKGRIWYFVCPSTKKRCRKLYSVSGYFLHREAFSGMYETQTYSNNTRALIRLFDRTIKMERAYELLYSKHFKTHYAQKPTKRYLKVLQTIQQAEGIDPAKLMIM